MEEWIILQPSVVKINYENKDYLIKELCCFNEKTQFASRMGGGCEDASHDIASLTRNEASLDGIIKLYSENTQKIEDISYKIVNDEPDFISDHKPIISEHRIGQTEFMLMSFNIEGLCRTNIKSDIFRERLTRFRDKLLPLIKKGFIICIQEVSLQTKISLTYVNNTLKRLKRIFEEKFPETTYEYDGFTGAVIYDSSVWSLKETLHINRENSNKKSNAHIFSCKEGDICVTNIHLKALTSTSLPSVLQTCNPQNIHTKEINNILEKIYQKTKFLIPIFMCGDYNNPTDKTDLIVCSLKLIKEKIVKTSWFW